MLMPQDINIRQRIILSFQLFWLTLGSNNYRRRCIAPDLALKQLTKNSPTVRFYLHSRPHDPHYASPIHVFYNYNGSARHSLAGAISTY
jgi:hypothetical protein